MADAVIARAGLAVRYPFWDKRVIEYCLALPAEQKCQGGWNRLVMRRAMNEILPPEVCWRRKKTDFTANFFAGLSAAHEREALRANLMNESVQEFLDQTALREMYQKFCSSGFEVDKSATRDAVRVFWYIASLSCWIRQQTQMATA